MALIWVATSRTMSLGMGTEREYWASLKAPSFCLSC